MINKNEVAEIRLKCVKMDVYSCAYYLTLFLAPVIAYLLLFEGNERRRGAYTLPDWYYPIRYYFAKNALKKRLPLENINYGEEPEKLQTKKEIDYHLIHGSDLKGNSIALKLSLKKNRLAEITIYLKLNGTIYQLPEIPEVTHCSTVKREFRAAGLEIQILEPFKRLRIVYNGVLSRDGKSGEYFRFNFIWTSAGRTIFYPQDTSADILADALARERWRDGNWLQMLPEETYYEQYGALKGTITTEQSSSQLNLPGYRKHYRGISESFTIHRDFSIFAVAEDGTVLNLGAKSYLDGCTQLRYGNLILNNGEVTSLTAHDLNLCDIGEGESLPEAFVVHFQAGKRAFKCVVHLNVAKASQEISSEENGWKVIRVPMECGLNAQQARGFASFWYRRTGPGKIDPTPLLTDINKRTCLLHFAKPLHDAYCKNLRFSGGKANPLALLASVESQDFEIPPGVVVCVAAFRAQIVQNKEVRDAVEEVERVALGIVDGNLEEVCKKAVEIISSSDVHDATINSVTMELQNVYNKFKVENETAWKWAVRSSAIGEDSAELSAAGQNSTFLGLNTREEILSALRKCWASSYSFSSVQYRLKNGLPVKTDLAVLIQKMVPADSAGVLFTCQPATGNPLLIVVTSNYGLGESVVSGKSEPDTITLNRDLQGNLSINFVTIGSKTERVVLSGENGTELQRTSEETSTKLSLTEEQALHLGRVGVSLEKSFGFPLDVEWAFRDGKLFVLQARPVTTLNSWSESELLHELDSAVLTEEDTFLTKANIGEVMPGALSALSRSTVAVRISKAMDTTAGNFLPDALKSLAFHQHQTFLEFTNVFSATYGEDNEIANRALDLSVFGHLVRNSEMASVVSRRYGKASAWQKFLYLLDTLKATWSANDRLKKSIETNRKVDLVITETETAEEAHIKIRDYLKVLLQLAEHHTLVSRASVVYQFIAMAILTENRAVTFTPEHYHDISLLFSCHEDVISAEIPKKLQLLAKSITEADLTREFLAAEDALGFLKTQSPRIHEEFRKFLDEQGHRALREFELQTVSWGARPEKLIEFVKHNVRNGNFGQTGANLTVGETIAKLLTPKSATTRSLLKFVIKKSRKAVARREATKCELSRSVDKLRKSYGLLARKLKMEGKIPEADLIYHLTDHEIGEVIKNVSSPVLVKKSLLRRRFYPKWDQQKFPEICRGIPVAEQEDNIPFRTDVEELKGTPVCMGEVQARACVITNVQDADELRQGDVLITCSTDTAWSLYFPMLSGVVTELGGLISHGAVIAREFSLPCIVGVANATRSFKTGDIVHLSGTKGFLRLVKAADE